MYDVVQLPDANMQEVGLNVPPIPPSDHDTDPVTVFAEFVVSVTCTEYDTVPPEESVVEVGVTAVLVTSV